MKFGDEATFSEALDWKISILVAGQKMSIFTA